MQLFGMEKLSLVDYDGYVAATVFTGSCNFRCGFCHNSPLVLAYDSLGTLPEEEVFEYLKKRKGILEGLCITGGEPTLCKDLPDFCEKVKGLGYSVKLDTNGTNPDMVKTLNENGLCDYFAMDVKNNKEDYAKIIGFDRYDTAKVEKTVAYFLSGKAKYEFRTTLIKEFHSEKNMAETGKWIKGADKYFLQKFKDSGDCIQSHLSPVEKEEALKFAEILKEYVPNTRLRGYDL